MFNSCLKLTSQEPTFSGNSLLSKEGLNKKGNSFVMKATPFYQDLLPQLLILTDLPLISWHLCIFPPVCQPPLRVFSFLKPNFATQLKESKQKWLQSLSLLKNS